MKTLVSSRSSTSTMAICEGYEARGYKTSSYYPYTILARSTSAISAKTTPTLSVKATPAPSTKTRITTESIKDFVSVLKTEIESSRAAVSSRDDSTSFAQIAFPEGIAQHEVLEALDKYDEDHSLKFVL